MAAIANVSVATRTCSAATDTLSASAGMFSNLASGQSILAILIANAPGHYGSWTAPGPEWETVQQLSMLNANGAIFAKVASAGEGSWNFTFTSASTGNGLGLFMTFDNTDTTVPIHTVGRVFLSNASDGNASCSVMPAQVYRQSCASLICMVHDDANDSVSAPPSGWTLIQEAGFGGVACAAFFRDIGASTAPSGLAPSAIQLTNSEQFWTSQVILQQTNGDIAGGGAGVINPLSGPVKINGR